MAPPPPGEPWEGEGAERSGLGVVGVAAAAAVAEGGSREEVEEGSWDYSRRSSASLRYNCCSYRCCLNYHFSSLSVSLPKVSQSFFSPSPTSLIFALSRAQHARMRLPLNARTCFSRGVRQKSRFNFPTQEPRLRDGKRKFPPKNTASLFSHSCRFHSDVPSATSSSLYQKKKPKNVEILNQSILKIGGKKEKLTQLFLV